MVPTDGAAKPQIYGSRMTRHLAIVVTNSAHNIQSVFTCYKIYLMFCVDYYYPNRK